jgi:hypothetical protein
MPDVLFVLITAAFFGLCVLYIKGCERILSGAEEGEGPAEEVAQ